MNATHANARGPRFIVLSHPRTGSTLLCDALGAHPELRVAQEIFNGVSEGDAPHVLWRRLVFLELFGVESITLPNGYLDESRDLITYADRCLDHYNGFKLMYDQLSETCAVWQHLVRHSRLKIIFIHRNKIDSLASLRLAQRTGIWQRYHGPMTSDHPFKLALKDVQRTVHTWEKQYQFFQTIFCHHSYLDLDYANLVGHWDITMRRVQDFLGIPAARLPMKLMKRTSLPTQQLIANYSSLNRKLCLSRAHKFFLYNKVF